MRNLNRTAAAALLLAAAVFSAAAQSGDQTVSAVNRIDWLQKTVTSTITLDARAAGIILPDGREAVSRKMTASIPELAGRPVFSLPVDSATTLGDAVRDGSVTLAQILRFLDEGEKTAPWFSPDLETCTMTSTVRLTDLQRMFIRHQNVWQTRRPLERVPTRTYSGIVIDARGQLPVHGEFTTDRLSPSLFPKIWDTGMTLAYERNMVEPETAAQNGILAYAAGPEDETCGERTGPDPLYIRAAGVYGIHRTDPVIARRDYLRIFCDEGNLELLKQGKVVILCDREMLQTELTPRVPDNSFYFLRRGIERRLAETGVDGVGFSDRRQGITLTIYGIRFVADSPQILPEEENRIRQIASALASAAADTRFLVEGHTASVGRPAGERTLSHQRAEEIARRLEEAGIARERITTDGYGGTRPVAGNGTEEGRAQNRRVEITVLLPE